MSNHIADANKMVSDTPRTDAEYERLFEIYQNAERINGPLCCAFENDMRLCRQLERELNAATSEIERLTAKVAQLYEGAEEQRQRIKPLEKDVMELKACNEYLRQKLGQRDDRIRHLIRLGLKTTRPEALDQWQEEEEL